MNDKVERYIWEKRENAYYDIRRENRGEHRPEKILEMHLLWFCLFRRKAAKKAALYATALPMNLFRKRTGPNSPMIAIHSMSC
jgi:hypothetical protein